MSTAAGDEDLDPDRISFTRTLRAARRSTRAGLGTATRNLAAALTGTTDEIVHELLPTRRLRSAARVVKRKMSNYGVKRAEHRHWPRPTHSSGEAVEVLGSSEAVVLRNQLLRLSEGTGRRRVQDH